MTNQNKKYKGWMMASSLSLIVAGQPMLVPFLPIQNASAHVANVQSLTLPEVQKVSFTKAAKFEEFSLNLSDEILHKISEKSGIRVQSQDKETKAWKAVDAKNKTLGYVLVDKVYGKHEFITYSVAIDLTGKVTHIEILDYRESYGGQVANADWREQFNGKTAEDKLVLDQDIKNISGATLSCKHIADGVKRMLSLYEIVLRDKA